MKFTKHFNDDTLNLRNLSKRKVLVSVIIGIMSALIIYGFSYVMRETFRLISFGFYLYPNIVSEVDRSFYNIFFAGLSVIFGNSIAVSFLFSSPQNLMPKHSLKRKRIINEQVFLNFNFAYWLGKIGLVFGAFSMCCMDFPFSTNTRYIAVLIIVVLYFESFKTLNQVLKHKKWKILLIHVLTLFLISFGISKIDIINYKAIDEIALEANPIVDLPKSFYYQDLDWSYPVMSYKVLQNDNGDLTIRNQYNEVIQIYEISNEIINERASFREELQSHLTVRISADKNIKLKAIKQIEALLFSIGQNRIVYNVNNENPLSRSYKQNGINKRISFDILQFRPKEASFYPPFPDRIFEEPVFKDTLNVYVENSVIIDGIKVPKSMLVNKFKNNVSIDILINYIISEKTTYQDYITVLSAHFKAVHELREKEQKVEDTYELYDAYREEQFELKMKYPIITIDSYNK